MTLLYTDPVEEHEVPVLDVLVGDELHIIAHREEHKPDGDENDSQHTDEQMGHSQTFVHDKQTTTVVLKRRWQPLRFIGCVIYTYNPIQFIQSCDKRMEPLIDFKVETLCRG